jgi:stage V sporulation protein SpoVS
MSATYSTNLALELVGTGDQAGNWGATNNLNLGTLIEQAISGYVTQSVSTGTDTTMTIPQGASTATLNARNMFIELTGTGGASTNLIVPVNKKLYFIYNNTSSGQVTVKVSGQTGISVANGSKVILVSNGTDVVNATSYGVIQSVTGVVYSSGTTLTAATGAQMVAAIGSTAVTNATNATAITNTGGWNVTPSGTKLNFIYNGTTVASLDSSGNLITLGTVSAGGTP